MSAVHDAMHGAALHAHVARCRDALDELDAQTPRLARWAHELYDRLSCGHRLLVAGNGGSAALAQHLTAELVGRYCDERRPFSAIALTADTAALTAIGNDYGYQAAFARQVLAHARGGDVVLLLSTSGRSPNLVEAARAAASVGAAVWAMTGPAPNPLSARVDDAVSFDTPATATVQEVQQVAVHLLCLEFDRLVLA